MDVLAITVSKLAITLGIPAIIADVVPNLIFFNNIIHQLI